MKATDKVKATANSSSNYKVKRSVINNALKKDLHMSDSVEVLRGIMPKTQPKNMSEIAYFECIDDNDFKEYEDAIADSPNQNAARKAYSVDPKPFYVMAILTNGRESCRVKLMDKKMITQARKDGPFLTVELI